jgi:hypothetical protein
MQYSGYRTSETQENQEVKHCDWPLSNPKPNRGKLILLGAEVRATQHKSRFNIIYTIFFYETTYTCYFLLSVAFHI